MVGYLFLLEGAAISGKSNRLAWPYQLQTQNILLSAAAQEAVWLQQLTSDLLNKSIRETTILEDNQSAMSRTMCGS